jgi:hypothetical protein
VICSPEFLFGIGQGVVLALTNHSVYSTPVVVSLKNGSGQVTSSGTYTVAGGASTVIPFPLPTAPTNITGSSGLSYVTFGDMSIQLTVPTVITSKGPCISDITAAFVIGSTNPATPTGTSGIYTAQSYKNLTSGSWGWGARTGGSKVSTPACTAAVRPQPGTTVFENLVWAPGQIVIFKITNPSNVAVTTALTLADSSGKTTSSSTVSIGPGMTYDWIPSNPSTPSTITIGGKTLTLYFGKATLAASPLAGSNGMTYFPELESTAWLATATPSQSSSLIVNTATVFQYEKPYRFGKLSEAWGGY